MHKVVLEFFPILIRQAGNDPEELISRMIGWGYQASLKSFEGPYLSEAQLRALPSSLLTQPSWVAEWFYAMKENLFFVKRATPNR